VLSEKISFELFVPPTFQSPIQIGKILSQLLQLLLVVSSLFLNYQEMICWNAGIVDVFLRFTFIIIHLSRQKINVRLGKLRAQLPTPPISSHRT
jgi:hypothetical protein